MYFAPQPVLNSALLHICMQTVQGFRVYTQVDKGVSSLQLWTILETIAFTPLH